MRRSCDHAEKPVESVGEPEGPRKVPTFEENVGVPELVETNECINWTYNAGAQCSMQVYPDFFFFFFF